MPHTSQERKWRKPTPVTREVVDVVTLPKFIPVISVMTLQEAHRVMWIRKWHQDRIKEHPRHLQIWRECESRLQEYDKQVFEGHLYG
jgi:hypothetical protein